MNLSNTEVRVLDAVDRLGPVGSAGVADALFGAIRKDGKTNPHTMKVGRVIAKLRRNNLCKPAPLRRHEATKIGRALIATYVRIGSKVRLRKGTVTGARQVGVRNYKTATVENFYDNVEGGVVLSRAIGGFRSWNVKDLELV